MITKIGGCKPGEWVRNACRKILDPGLVYLKFSWTGTRNKEKRCLGSTKICIQMIGIKLLFFFF